MNTAYTMEGTQRVRQLPNTTLDSQAHASIHFNFHKSHLEAALSDNSLETI